MSSNEQISERRTSAALHGAVSGPQIHEKARQILDRQQGNAFRQNTGNPDGGRGSSRSAVAPSPGAHPTVAAILAEAEPHVRQHLASKATDNTPLLARIEGIVRKHLQKPQASASPAMDAASRASFAERWPTVRPMRVIGGPRIRAL